MNSVHTPVEPDRRHWHLDKTLNITHLLATISIVGSLFMFANSMDRRVAVLEEKMQAQVVAGAQSREEMKDLAADVKHELRLLRTELLRVMSEKGAKQ